ncbi:unnamed protein product [Gulo gulo]|uniref:Uncharacterized protein n=1 Tax=Gulo gulo TaxID=48420 RepID=A0A9X9PVX6_GULGU|nr:unnamed protein product [Gulo gulo]
MSPEGFLEEGIPELKTKGQGACRTKSQVGSISGTRGSRRGRRGRTSRAAVKTSATSLNKFKHQVLRYHLLQKAAYDIWRPFYALLAPHVCPLKPSSGCNFMHV